jgi:molybdate transport system substrate-binding protein
VTRLALLAVLTATLAAAAPASSAPDTRITVFAAASLTDVFPKIDRHPLFSFAGSNALVAQIEAGAPADVFASANTTLPQTLFDKHLCAKPVVFTRNKLVVIVPRKNPAHIKKFSDLTRPGVKIVIAARGVPAGNYTLQVLAALHLTGQVMANVVSQETDVREVLAKIVLTEADAGFVYRTDAKSVSTDVKVITIPKGAQPTVAYGMCVVPQGGHTTAARAFVKKVLSKRGQKKLRAFGFLPRR